MAKNEHAVALGRLGKGQTSEAKKTAARANARKGGAPTHRDVFEAGWDAALKTLDVGYFDPHPENVADAYAAWKNRKQPKPEKPTMTMSVSGPMFEPAKSELWESVTCQHCRKGRSGAHYNTFGCHDADGMAALRAMFPEAKANEFNFVLFSTSGVHGMYTTIEEAEDAYLSGWKDEEGEEWHPHVTFLIVHPRIVCLRYGNCEPNTPEDFAYLKNLRESSWAVAASIGRRDCGDE